MIGLDLLDLPGFRSEGDFFPVCFCWAVVGVDMMVGGRLAAGNRTLRLCRPAMMGGMDKFLSLSLSGGGRAGGYYYEFWMKEMSPWELVH